MRSIPSLLIASAMTISAFANGADFTAYGTGTYIPDRGEGDFLTALFTASKSALENANRECSPNKAHRQSNFQITDNFQYWNSTVMASAEFRCGI